TAIGRMDPDEEVALADVAGAAELHVECSTADRISAVLGARLRDRQGMRYYRLDGRPRMEPDRRCRTLGPADLDSVSKMFRAHYPESVFSRWMLEQPFIGLFEDDALLACGGVIAAAGGIANLGNFLVVPAARNRGLARAVAATLTHQLADHGTELSTLGTTDKNPAACRAYEAIGFRCYDRRVQLDLVAHGAGRPLAAS
ncbi:MAG: GNAT family N-acetyltransferase, partial [Caulobacteraceae bacterium]